MEMFIVFIGVGLVLVVAQKIAQEIAKSVNWTYDGGFMLPMLGVFVGTLCSDVFPHDDPTQRSFGLFVMGSLGAVIASIVLLYWQNKAHKRDSYLGQLVATPFVSKVVVPVIEGFEALVVSLIAIVMLVFFLRDNEYVSPLLKWVFSLFHQ